MRNIINIKHFSANDLTYHGAAKMTSEYAAEIDSCDGFFSHIDTSKAPNSPAFGFTVYTMKQATFEVFHIDDMPKRGRVDYPSDVKLSDSMVAIFSLSMEE